MKKKFKVTGLQCAHCAAKIEEVIKNIDGVTDCNVSFLLESVKINADNEANLDEILLKANELADKIEPGTVIK